MRFDEICLNCEFDQMCESFKEIVNDIGTTEDKSKSQRMSAKDFTALKNEIIKKELSGPELKKFFLQQCIESYDFSREVLREAQNKLKD